MNELRTPLEAQSGESYSAQKKRFMKSLDFIGPYMDRNYSGPTLRRFTRTASQVRNIKQVGVVDWDVLRYWAEEYVPIEVLPKAWAKTALAAA